MALSRKVSLPIASMQHAIYPLSSDADIEDMNDLIELIRKLGRSSHGDLAMALYRRFVQRAEVPVTDSLVYDAAGGPLA